MPTEYRKDRKKWGFRFYLHGKCWKKYVWDTEVQARNAEAELRTELLKAPPIATDSLGNVAAAYLIDSAENGRSKWRLQALRANLNAFILPFFKAATPMSAITETDIESFIKHHKRRGVKNMTIWHYVKDIRALFYWAMEKKHRYVRVNPVVEADLGLIKRRKAVKPPLNLKDFERAFTVLNQYERAWWLTMECLGLRMDECNRLLRSHPDFDTQMIHIPGTKTEGAECYMPMSLPLQAELKAYLATRTDDSPYLFPGRAFQTKGKKIYSRTWIFEKIRRYTALNAYMEKHPDADKVAAVKQLKVQGYPGGVKLKPKELRDYFATQVSAQTSDSKVVMDLMRHTSLDTTTRYTRTVNERMAKAVENLGNHAELGAKKGACTSGGNFWGRFGGDSTPKTTRKSMLAKILSQRLLEMRAGESSDSTQVNLGESGLVRKEPFNAVSVLHALEMRCDVGEA
jgi:integrase